MNNPIDEYVSTALRSYTVLAIVALLLGAAVAPYAVTVAEGNEQYVAVVNIDEPITPSTSQDVVTELRSVRNNDSVKAVVLKINTPGGGVAGSESMYAAVKRLEEEKPVYTSVGSVAASGGYYAAIPSDRIYVTSGSIVGSVGVRGTAPSGGLPAGVTTGPDKASLTTQDEYYAAIEASKRSFVGSVMEERGENLTVSRETVAEAGVYFGGRAVETGYADEVGGTEEAIAAAAEDAGLSSYQMSYRDPAQPPQTNLLNLRGSDAANSTVAANRSPFGSDGVEHPRLLMLYGTIEDDSIVYNSSAQGGVADE